MSDENLSLVGELASHWRHRPPGTLTDLAGDPTPDEGINHYIAAFSRHAVT